MGRDTLLCAIDARIDGVGTAIVFAGILLWLTNTTKITLDRLPVRAAHPPGVTHSFPEVP